MSITVKDLKDALRQYKSANCPTISKKNKKALLKLVESLKLPVKHTIIKAIRKRLPHAIEGPLQPHSKFENKDLDRLFNQVINEFAADQPKKEKSRTQLEVERMSRQALPTLQMVVDLQKVQLPKKDRTKLNKELIPIRKAVSNFDYAISNGRIPNYLPYRINQLHDYYVTKVVSKLARPRRGPSESDD